MSADEQPVVSSDDALRALSARVALALNTHDQLTREFIFRVFELIKLFDKKQRSYGPSNIAAFGERGVLVRATDKLARLRNLAWEGTGNPLSDETIDDTWGDLATYAVIALLCRDGNWPGVDAAGGPPRLSKAWVEEVARSLPV